MNYDFLNDIIQHCHCFQSLKLEEKDKQKLKRILKKIEQIYTKHTQSK